MSMRIVDMHCDTIGKLFAAKLEGNEEGLYENRSHVDLIKLKNAGYLLQNFAMFIPIKRVEDPTIYCQNMIDYYEEEIKKNNQVIDFVYTYSDIEKNERKGKLSALLTIEEGAVLKGKVELLEEFYRRGVRMLTLTWNYENELGYPNAIEADKNKGLKAAGLSIIERMNELGMIIDVSHLSDGGFFSVCQNTKQPFVASHSNARSVTDHRRNLTDDMIRALAERGGVMGLNFCAAFLDNRKNPFGKVEYMVRHAHHIVNTGGIECLGLGTDFDGIEDEMEISDASKMPILWESLKESGLKESDLDKIFSENVLRLYRDVLQ